MAYASLLSLTQTLEQILQSQIQFCEESQSLLHEEQLQMRSLHGKLSNLLSFLENSSPINSESFLNLEGKIRDAAYEAEDLIESHITKQILSQGSVIEKNYKEALQIVLEKLDSILEEVDEMTEKNGRGGLRPSKFDDALVQTMDPLTNESNSAIEMDGVEDEVRVHSRKLWRADSSKSAFTNKSVVVGFEDDMLQIKELLEGSSSRLETISIVGMGGIGKTTLARSIYNDSFVKCRFDVRAWTVVSREYDVVALLANLLRSMGELIDHMNGKDVEDLKLKLYQKLKSRRYLIVMDDVWNPNIFEEFIKIFPDDHIGSRIITTSRSSNVSGFESSNSHIHHLNFLNPDQSWNLLRQKAFGKESCPRDLVDIGRRIAENCKGLALALVAIGGILSKVEKTQADWEYVAENMKSTETGNYDDLMKILSWSYNQLPHHLRTSFLYMGVFPEDSVVHVFHLIMLWVVNGFIKPVPFKTLEEVAMEYLEELINRNLIMVRERSYDGGEIKTCIVHDLVRDLCIKRAEEEKFIVIIDKDCKIYPGFLNRYRHLTITGRPISPLEFGDIYNSTFRSFRCCKEVFVRNMPFKLLKVFEACDVFVYRFPIELVELVNLRYMFLIFKTIGKIPVSISKLRYLQTFLVFIYSRSLVERIILDSEILQSPQLRHLWVEEGILHNASGGCNDNLQTLCGLKIFVFTKEAIGIFPNLKRLGVKYDGTKWRSSGLENLVRLCQLEYLKLRVLPFFEVLLKINVFFPVKLRKLSLGGPGSIILSQRQMSKISSLPNLEVLTLKYVKFKRKEGWKTNEGEFPKLKLLHL